jgi:hypothetical protein
MKLAKAKSPRRPPSWEGKIRVRSWFAFFVLDAGCWANGELAVAGTLGLYGSPSNGYTYAKLLPKDDVGGITPKIPVPAWVGRQR